jgi:hypothetical protein
MPEILNLKELSALLLEWGYPEASAFARAIESAVSVKMSGLKMVTEREKLLACREAFLKGQAVSQPATTTKALGVSVLSNAEPLASVDDYYPLPTIQQSRIVLLSNGLEVSGAYDASGVVAWTCGDQKAKDGDLFAFARTAEDARALADLLEHPFESVPDPTV